MRHWLWLRKKTIHQFLITWFLDYAISRGYVLQRIFSFDVEMNGSLLLVLLKEARYEKGVAGFFRDPKDER
jgi:hypothetical protein